MDHLGRRLSQYLDGLIEFFLIEHPLDPPE